MYWGVNTKGFKLNTRGLNIKVIAFMSLFIIFLVYVFISCVSPIAAQPSDSIHNWPVSVRELSGNIEFSGTVKFEIKGDTTIFTQAIDISYYNTILPIYSYFQVSDPTAEMLAGFEGTSHPGIFDSTFFSEVDISHFQVLVSNQTESFLSNYEEGCPTSNVGICFNQAFGMQYIRLKFIGTPENTIGAEVRWSILMQKKARSKESRAFSIKDTKS